MRLKPNPMRVIQDLQQVYHDPQLQAREMFMNAEHPTAGEITMIGSPLKLSRTPVSLKTHPPDMGEHNKEFL